VLNAIIDESEGSDTVSAFDRLLELESSTRPWMKDKTRLARPLTVLRESLLWSLAHPQPKSISELTSSDSLNGEIGLKRKSGLTVSHELSSAAAKRVRGVSDGATGESTTL